MRRRAAVYCRYSSENQRETSIDDQIASCRRDAAARGFVVRDDHVYVDRARSGASHDRSGLVALLAAASQRCFEALFVDDLSRLSRSNLLLLGTLADLDYAGVRLISVADHLDTADDASTLAVQDTRGFQPAPALRPEEQDAARPARSEGTRVLRWRAYLRVSVTPVRRSSCRFRWAFSRCRIPHAHSPSPGCGCSSDLRRVRCRRPGHADFRPLSMRRGCLLRRPVPLAGVLPPSTESFAISSTPASGRGIVLGNAVILGPVVATPSSSLWRSTSFRNHPDLRIIPQSVWDDVQACRAAVAKVWPGGKRRGFTSDQGSRSDVYPSHLFDGMLRCACCKQGHRHRRWQGWRLLRLHCCSA